MGAWGSGLFESDCDLDMIADLSEEIGTELMRADEISQPKPTAGFGPASLVGDKHDQSTLKELGMTTDDTRAHLDNGNFARVFENYMNIKETMHMVTFRNFASGTYACVLLAAAAMLVGAKISKEHRLYLKNNYKACGLMKGGIGQMSKALEKYTDGKPYKFEEPDRTDQVREMTSRDALAKAGQPILSNHFGDRFFEEDIGTPDPQAAMLKMFKDKCCTVCKKGDASLDDGEKIKTCGRCGKAHYCGTVCQRIDWKNHKKVCATLATGEAKIEDVNPFFEMFGMEGLKTFFMNSYSKMSEEEKADLAKRD